jgi:hypothetical protein
LNNTIQGNMFPSLERRSPGSDTALRKSLFQPACEPGKTYCPLRCRYFLD